MFLGAASTAGCQQGRERRQHLPGLGLWGQLPLIRASFVQVAMVNDRRDVFT